MRSINKEDRVKGIPSWSKIQSFQWTKSLLGRESLHCYYSKQTRWLTRQNKEWQGWGGDLREKWVLSCLFHQVCLQVVSWQISATWSPRAQGQMWSEDCWSATVSQTRLTVWSCPVQGDASNLCKCVSGTIDEKMCHFLWDTPLLMICQILHTADFMFCRTPDTLTATWNESVIPCDVS